MVTKHFFNESPYDIEITLYEAGKDGLKLKTFGTRIVSLSSGSNCTVRIGDLHHSFLQGIRITAKNHGECISLQRGTKNAEGRLYCLLNDHDSFIIGFTEHSFVIEGLAH